MYLRRILEQVGDRILTDVNVAGTDLINGINKLRPDNPLANTATGKEVLTAFDALPSVDQVRIETIVEDWMLANFGTTLSTPIPATLNATQDYRAFIAMMFSIALVLMAVAYTAMVIYVAWRNRTLPDWSDGFIPFTALTAVVWNYNGLLTRENRDAIAAGLGSVPGGFIASIVQAITTGRRRQGP